MARLLLVTSSRTSSPARQLLLLFPIQLSLVSDRRFGDVRCARRLPVHFGTIVDGRSGRQWFASIAEYLEWRSGRRWLPVRFRFHPESAYYTEGLNTLQQAFKPGLVTSRAVCECVYCVTGAPFADEQRERKAAA